MKLAATWGPVLWALLVSCGSDPSARTELPRSDMGQDLDVVVTPDLPVQIEPMDQPDDLTGFACPQDGVRGPGTHRLFLQGHGAEPDADGVYPMLHPWGPLGEDGSLCDDSKFVTDTNGDGVWQPGEEPRPLGPPALVHGEHFLLGPGSFVEFSIPLCVDITGNVAFYIPNFDVAGSEALHQLFVVGAAGEFLIAEAIDDEAGNSGYNPFIRQIEGNNPPVQIGDRLLLRSTNLNGLTFSVMVWQPPSEYESWVIVEAE